MRPNANRQKARSEADDEVASERKRGPAADRPPVQRADDRQFVVPDPADRPDDVAEAVILLLRIDPVGSDDLAQLGPGAEHPPRSGQDNRRDGLVILELVECGEQLPA